MSFVQIQSAFLVFFFSFLATTTSLAKEIIVDGHRIDSSMKKNLIEINKELSREDLSIEQLHEMIRQYFKVAWQLPAELFNKTTLKAEGPEAVQNSFQLRLKLGKILKRAQAENKLTKDLIRDTRNLMRAGRYIEDMTLEVTYQTEQEKALLKEGDLKPKAGFSGGVKNNLINAGFQNELNLKSGDLILVRGNSFNSAAISRVGDIDSNFSHIAMVHVQPQVKNEANTIFERSYVMEALIETGTGIRTLKNFLEEHAGYRLAVFRMDGKSNIPDRAAYWMYNHIYQTKIIQKKKMPYNFSMDLTVTNKLFCSQLAYMAYQKGAGYNLMLFPTELSKNYRNFYKFIGVKADSTYAPGDIETDPRFTLVREWRDYNFTKSIRYKDMILNQLFNWMETYNFKFSSTPVESSIATLAWVWRRIPLVNELMPYDVPMNQSVSSIGIVITLQKAGSLFEKALDQKAQANLRKDRLESWTPVEAFGLMETLRTELKDDYQKWLLQNDP